MRVRVATWNTEWATATSERGARVSALIRALDSEVLVVTEGSSALLPANGHVIDGGDQWGYGQESTRRKVLAWSRSPWREVERLESGAGAGRVVVGTTDTSVGPVQVIAVCIPWRDCHVRTGGRDAEQWAEHIECCAQLEEWVRSTTKHLPIVVAGDFNQRVPRHGQPVEVFEALERALRGLTVHTGDVTKCGRLIDHIATTNQLVPSNLEVWPGDEEHGRLSDHAGAAVDLTPRG